MTTLTAQPGRISHRPRVNIALISVVAVGILGVSAAVTVPRLMSSEPASTRPATVAPAQGPHTSEHSYPAGGFGVGTLVDRLAQPPDNSPRQLRHGKGSFD